MKQAMFFGKFNQRRRSCGVQERRNIHSVLGCRRSTDGKRRSRQPVFENGYPKTEPEWYRCQIFAAAGKQTKVAETLKKGTFVAACAYPQAEGWIDKNNEVQARISKAVRWIDF